MCLKNLKNRFLLILVFVISHFLFLSISDSYGGVVRDVDIEGLVKSSDVIVAGTSLTSYSNWNSDKSEIYTYTVFEVEETLKGDEGDPLVVESLGGRVDNLVSTVIGAPKFVDGERSVLFLFRRNSGYFGVVGLNLGKFNIFEKDGEKLVINPYARNLTFSDSSTGNMRATDKITLSWLIKVIGDYK